MQNVKHFAEYKRKTASISIVKVFPAVRLIFCYNEMNDTYVRFCKGEMVLRFLGIDPGIAIVGFGFVDKIGNKVVPVQYGCIQTEAHTPEEERLLHV